jgi:NAD-dependent deacetylase
MHPPVEIEDLDDALARAAGLVRGAARLAVLTGAGVSAESGITTFRGAGGLWEGHRIEEVATPEGFDRDPVLVWRFYNARRANVAQAKPNPGHVALAELERRWTPERFALVTQNIDGLHQAAGSRHVLELHGSLARVRCTGCGRKEDRPGEALPDQPRCAQCGQLLRPDVVWFNEMLPADVWEASVQAVGASGILFVVGTSAVVYPAAGLVEMAVRLGTPVIEVNPDRTPVTNAATVSLRGKSGEMLPRLVELLG